MVVVLSIFKGVNAGDIDWSTAAIVPLDETKIGVYGLKYAPTPDISYNVDFIFNDETLSLEVDSSTLVTIEETQYAAADMIRGGLLYDK